MGHWGGDGLARDLDVGGGASKHTGCDSWAGIAQTSRREYVRALSEDMP